jgi:hypothetical protein
MSHANVHMDIVIVSMRVVQPLFSRDMGCNSSGTVS